RSHAMPISPRAFLAVLVFPLICHAQDLILVQDGKSSFSIVISADASPSVHRGATELQTHIEKISGARLPIVTDDGPAPEHAIFVGPSRQTDALHVDADVKTLGSEGFLLKTQNSHVFILGSNIRGAMYGCTSFLETLGVRWFTPTITQIPSRTTINLPAINERQIP